MRKGPGMSPKLQNEDRGGCLQAAQVTLLGSFRGRVEANVTHFQSGTKDSIQALMEVRWF